MRQWRIKIVIALLFLALVAAAGVGGFYFYHYRLLTDEVATLSQTIAELEQSLAEAEEDKNRLTAELAEQTAIVDSFGGQIKAATDIVDTLDKLSKTDAELLQKYSKTYFLNEHYVPSRLTLIDRQYFYDENKPQQIHAEVESYLIELLNSAARDGFDLKIVSAYRSFGVQTDLKTQYQVFYGEGANRFSADQGYSEHQLGTTVDFTSSEVDGHPLTGFGQTEAYQWLLAKAHRFGFVLSYPEGNEYYQYEPWHWRFVGRDLASDLKQTGESFYDRSQREINDYLIKIFD
ncbi:MAG: D-alanyl-D-alanine carboxypeptidase family protein [Candidatus Paceibacterota bacterium]